MPVWPCILVVRTYGGGRIPPHEDRQEKKRKDCGSTHNPQEKKKERNEKNHSDLFFPSGQTLPKVSRNSLYSMTR